MVYACYTVKIYKNKPQINFKHGVGWGAPGSVLAFLSQHILMVRKCFNVPPPPKHTFFSRNPVNQCMKYVHKITSVS